MSLADSIQVAIEALIANKMRAALTMLGIVIGVGAVIALMAVGQGSQKAVTDKIAGLGSNLIFIRPGSTSANGVRQGNGTAQTLSLTDAQAIPGAIPQVTAVAPETRFFLQIQSNGQNTFARALGVDPDYPAVLGLTLADGEFISQDDVDHSTRNVVLGASIAAQLFPDGNAVGTQVRAAVGPRNIVSIKVVGVLNKKGGTTTASQDDQIFLPISTVQRQIQGVIGGRNTSPVSQITVQVASKDAVPAVKAQLDDLMKQRHQVAESDVTIESQDDIAAAVNQVSQTMTVLLGSIAGISLIVGGIGIMNIMLVSVTERTREIGIRKAVGARSGDIMMQFLTEALTVTIAGGLIGIAVGVGTAEFLNGRNIAGLGNNVQTVISWSSVAVAFAVSAAIGIFFGLYPANRAARLSPIQALRYE